jgi:deoxynucleoside triphosphate triphosphohydrolase SAMHD1
MGRGSERSWPEECKEEDGIVEETLPEAQLDAFRVRAIHIVTCVGRPLAEENLRTILIDHGFTHFRGVQWKHLAEGVVEWSDDLKDFLCDVGTSLISWSKYRKDPSKLDAAQLGYCKGKAFGYGNVGSLVATASNVPTATVTAIWSPGMYRGSPWMPLMIRRNKLRHLVLG